MNQGIGRDHSVEWIAMDGGEFSRPVDNASFQIQNRDVLYAGLFFNPHFRTPRQGQFACVVLQYNFPDGSQAQKSLFVGILKCGLGGGSELSGIAGEPDE